ncbi:MAG TPA: heme-binding domain-containing protein [Prolixibacteraceae bacterium]|nr:heme-binding domain-containing protein [Prolixibacteraceae bacterium]
MKKYLKITGVIIVSTFILIQFYQPEKNDSEMGNEHIIVREEIPDEIEKILTRSCFDCHSNQTHYKWFHHISPISLIVNNHISNGKKELNLSEWKTTDLMEKLSMLDNISDEVKNKNMPLKSYTLIHREAKLSENEIKQITDWCEKFAEHLIAERE